MHLHDLWRHGADLTMTRRPAAERARRVRLLLFDVDGVLTDGKILLHADGTESKQFDIKRRRGHRLGPTRRPDDGPAVGATVGGDDRAGRAAANPIVRQGAADKLETLRARSSPARGWPKTRSPTWATTCWTCRCSGASGCRRRPADAAPEVRARVHWVSARRAATAPSANWWSWCSRPRDAGKRFVDDVARGPSRA